MMNQNEAMILCGASRGSAVLPKKSGHLVLKSDNEYFRKETSPTTDHLGSGLGGARLLNNKIHYFLAEKLLFPHSFHRIDLNRTMLGVVTAALLLNSVAGMWKQFK